MSEIMVPLSSVIRIIERAAMQPDRSEAERRMGTDLAEAIKEAGILLGQRTW